MATSPFAQYVRDVDHAFRAGSATEHTYRPFLKSLIEALGDHVDAINEPRHVACGAPDYAVQRPTRFGPLTIGHIEAKDVGVSLCEAQKSEQLKRYRRSLENLVLTDYLEFWWFVGGEPRAAATLASVQKGRVASSAESVRAAEQLLTAFLGHAPQPITRPQDLAERMAKLTHFIRDIIVEAFETGEASDVLRGWRQAFAQVLIADLDQPEKTAEFADMFAQTLAYGLFSARVMDTSPGFTRAEAQRLVPRTNPFLRGFFGEIAGFKLDDEPFVGFVDDLVGLLGHADMQAILADFGKRTRQDDPVVHFYETFLGAYDPKLKKSRGVFFTPEPVVSYIVRSVDSLLRTAFGCPDGLADSTTILAPNRDPAMTVRGTSQPRKTRRLHRVLVLDPATGTATFPYVTIDLIRRRFMERSSAGLWSAYVREHLLPRIFGFELLMAPYAVAHFKLGLQLAGFDLPEAQRERWAYDFAADERIGIYLTNTLEPPHELSGLPLFTQFVANETSAANQVKQDLPILVVFGNPPYSNFASMNRNPWILTLLDDYKRGLGERKINIDDDFIKFIRFAQWRIEQSGSGIVAFITSNTYLDGVSHRRMRESLLATFDDIYLLNLHGSSRTTERAPDGSTDENVFDIQQGVAVVLFVKRDRQRAGDATVSYADLYGTREHKYAVLSTTDVSSTQWQPLQPRASRFLLVPHDHNRDEEYGRYVPLSDIFPLSTSAVQTNRDSMTVAFTEGELEATVDALVDLSVSDQVVAESFGIPEVRHWSLGEARRCLASMKARMSLAVPYDYRPFDERVLFYAKELVHRPRPQLAAHMLGKSNTVLIATRGAEHPELGLAFVGRHLVDKRFLGASRGEAKCTPLYLYADERQLAFDGGGRKPNIADSAMRHFQEVSGLELMEAAGSDLVRTCGPEDVLGYVYAVLQSEGYRSRYSEALVLDYPRVPLCSSGRLFRELAVRGKELVSLHLLDQLRPFDLITTFPIGGENAVHVGYPRYSGEDRRVYINELQFFEGVAATVWATCVCGYQVCQKWLKDRRGRSLTYDELSHYGKIVTALAETIRIMREIDEVIEEHGGWPIK